MKFFKLFIVLVVTFCYLYYSYIRFYHIIGDTNLKSPYTQQIVNINTNKNNDTFKYYVLGDSLSAGVGANSIETTFPYLWASQYSILTNKNIEIHNLAQPGGTSRNVIDSQMSLVDKNTNVVTLLIGTNDIHNKMSLNEFSNNYEIILDTLVKETKAKIIVINIPYLGSNKSVYPPFNLLLNYRLKQFNKIIDLIIRQEKYNGRVTLVDLYSATYNTAMTDQKYYSSDYFHPSEYGYLKWSTIINAN